MNRDRVVKPDSADEWLKILGEAQRESPDGLTTRELMKVFGVSENTMRARIREWMEMGRVEYSGTKTMPTLCGHPFHVPVYRLVRKK